MTGWKIYHLKMYFLMKMGLFQRESWVNLEDSKAAAEEADQASTQRSNPENIFRKTVKYLQVEVLNNFSAYFSRV